MLVPALFVACDGAGRADRDASDSLTAVIAGLERDNEALRAEARSGVHALEQQLESLRYSVYAGRTSLSPTMEQRYREYGLGEPGADILQDLENQNALIPEPGSGAGFRFLAATSLLVDDHHVLGGFEDGHASGWALLHVEVDPQGRIHWKLLCYSLE